MVQSYLEIERRQLLNVTGKVEFSKLLILWRLPLVVGETVLQLGNAYNFYAYFGEMAKSAQH